MGRIVACPIHSNQAFNIQRRNDFEQVAQQDLQKRYNELLAPIIDKAKAAIDKVVTAGSYLAVFDTSTGSLAYFDEAMLTDLAPAVKKELGITDAPAAAPAAAAAPAGRCRRREEWRRQD